MKLIEALSPGQPARIAIVGGGGKTTALFQLGRQIKGLAWATTTTHLGTDQLIYADRHFLYNSPAEVDVDALTAQKLSLITGPFTADNRVLGPSPEVMAKLVELADQKNISLIVEADGARSHPLKAPAEYEPVIPPWSEIVIVVVGCSVFGKPFNAEWVHRVAEFSQLTGLTTDEFIWPAAVTRMLIHPLGGLKGIPANASKVVLFNQADVFTELDLLKREIPALLAGGYDRVVIGALTRQPEEIFCAQRV